MVTRHGFRQTDSHREHSFSNANAAIRRKCWESAVFDKVPAWLTGIGGVGKAVLKTGEQGVYEPERHITHTTLSLHVGCISTYREALAHQSLYEGKARLAPSSGDGTKSVSADIRFILQKRQRSGWLLRAPIYRFFSIYGYLRPERSYVRSRLLSGSELQAWKVKRWKYMSSGNITRYSVN